MVNFTLNGFRIDKSKISKVPQHEDGVSQLSRNHEQGH